MEEIVTPVGNGLYKLFGVPTDLNVTVVPTIRFEISFNQNCVVVYAATQRSEGAAWLGVAKRIELAAIVEAVRILSDFFIVTTLP